MIRHALLFAMTIGLAACGATQEREAGPPTAPKVGTTAAAPANPDMENPRTDAPGLAAPDAEEFDAVGTEPFWAVQVRKDSLRLSRPDYAELIVDAPQPRKEVKTLVWKAESMTVSITPGACSDGMSDRRYIYVAEVRVGGQILKGCAYRPGAAPSAGPES